MEESQNKAWEVILQCRDGMLIAIPQHIGGSSVLNRKGGERDWGWLAVVSQRRNFLCAVLCLVIHACPSHCDPVDL